MVICLDTPLQVLLSNMSLSPSSFTTPACKSSQSRRCLSEPVGDALPRRKREYRSEERGRAVLENWEKERRKLLEGLEKKEVSPVCPPVAVCPPVSPVCPPRSLHTMFVEEGKKGHRSSSSSGLTPRLKIHTWSYRPRPVDAEKIDFVETLPLEMSVLLLQRYIDPADLLSCRLVNKYWHQLCDLRSIKSQWTGFLADKKEERLRVGKENYLIPANHTSPANYTSPQARRMPYSPHNSCSPRRMSLSRGPMSPIQLAQDSPPLLWRVFHTPLKTPDRTRIPKHPSKPKIPLIAEDTTPTPEKQSKPSHSKNSKLERTPLQTLAYSTPNSQTSSLSRTSSKTSLSSLNSSKYLTPDAGHLPTTRSHTRSHTRSKRSPTSAEISPHNVQLNFNTCDGFKVPRTPTSPTPTTRSRPIASHKSRQRLRRL